MLLSAYRGLRAIRMTGECLCEEGFVNLLVVVGKTDVVLLVYGFKLGVEPPYDHVLEAVALYLEPFLHLVGRYVLHIARHVVARIGVGALGADRRHHLIILVGDEVSCGELRQAVYLAVGQTALLRVGELAVGLVAGLDGVEQRLLCRIVRRAERCRALEHDVLQIVCQTGCLGRVVAASGAHGDVGLYARLLLVHRQIHFQAVVERVDACVHQVAADGLILVILGLGRR